MAWTQTDATYFVGNKQGLRVNLLRLIETPVSRQGTLLACVGSRDTPFGYKQCTQTGNGNGFRAIIKSTRTDEIRRRRVDVFHD